MYRDKRFVIVVYRDTRCVIVLDYDRRMCQYLLLSIFVEISAVSLFVIYIYRAAV